MASVPSQVGREFGADTVEVGLPALAVGPVDRTGGSEAAGELLLVIGPAAAPPTHVGRGGAQ